MILPMTSEFQGTSVNHVQPTSFQASLSPNKGKQGSKPTKRSSPTHPSQCTLLCVQEFHTNLRDNAAHPVQLTVLCPAVVLKFIAIQSNSKNSCCVSMHFINTRPEVFTTRCFRDHYSALKNTSTHTLYASLTLILQLA